MQNLKLLVGVIVGTLVLVFAVAFLFSNNGTETPTNFDQTLISADARHTKSFLPIVDAIPSPTSSVSPQASGSAQQQKMITLTEFSDFQCPACRAAQTVVDQLARKYQGNLRLVYRNFPLESIHKNARGAAMVAEAAALQGKFWEMHDLLFEKQDDWAEENDPQEKFIGYAQQLDLNIDQFKADQQKPEIVERINKDIADGFSLGINATPTFFVDNQKVNIRDLEQVIDAQLSK